MLAKLDIVDLKILRNLYNRDWPKHVGTCATIDNFIDRFENHPEWMEKVQFLVKNKSDLTDGSFVLIYKKLFMFYDTLEAAPYGNLKSLLKSISFGENPEIWLIREELWSLTYDLIRESNLKVIEESSYRGNVLNYTLDKVQSKLTRPPDSFYYAPLKSSDIPKIKSALTYEVSTEYFEDIIKYNPSTGLYRKDDGELIAWCIMHESGDQGALEVVEKYRNKKIGSGVLWQQVLKAFQRNKLNFNYIYSKNEAATKLTSNMGNMEYFGTARIFITQKKANKSHL